MTRTLGRALLVLSASVVALLALEVLTRVLDVKPRPVAALQVADYRLSDNPILGYEYRPGVRPDDPHFDDSHKGFAFNSAGFRDYEYPVAKDHGTFRIVVLGDSTTAGNGVTDVDLTYPKQLERLLNQGQSGASRYDVLNMGVGGYHTLQEAETLRIKGSDYSPDLVLLTVCLNDFSLDDDGGVREDLMEQARRAGGRSAGGVSRSLLKYSRLAFIVNYRVRALLADRDDAYHTHILKGRTTVRAGFELLADLQREKGFAALVVILPGFDSPFDRYQHADIHQRILDASSGLGGFTVIDLLQPFARIDNDAGRFSYDGLHMNETGHRAMAELLAPLIRSLRTGQ